MNLQATLLLATLVLSGCASSGTGPSASVPSMPHSPPDGLTDADFLSLIELASAETGVQPGEIQIVTAEAVTWSDGSLGCPAEGQMYTQALVPGYRVVLDVAGEEMAYHASESGDFRACANPMLPIDDGRVDR